MSETDRVTSGASQVASAGNDHANITKVLTKYASGWQQTIIHSAAQRLSERAGIHAEDHLKAAPMEVLLHVFPPSEASKELTLVSYVQSQLRKPVVEESPRMLSKKKISFDASKCLGTYGLSAVSHEHQMDCDALEVLYKGMYSSNN